MRILVLEDDLVTGRLLTKILLKYGDCVLIGDGMEAVKAFNTAAEDKNPYNLICLDIMVPSLDGQEVLSRIRRIERKEGLKRSKVLMITALGDLKNISKSYRHKCDGYYVKPIVKEKLENVVDRILEKQVEETYDETSEETFKEIVD
jgi:two-component system chemotaxis response regulator CheY